MQKNPLHHLESTCFDMLSKKRIQKLKMLAIAEAKKSEGRCKHVSFLVKSNKIVARGVNKLKTDTWADKLYKFPYVHSELSAIKNLPKSIDASECTLYNFRVNKNLSGFMISKPCRGCCSLLDLHNVKEIYYTDHSGNLIKG